MIKYAKVINQETGLCEVGIGSNTDFYKSIGMVELDVEQSDVNNNWYLTEKCPHKSEEEKEQEKRERINKLSMTKYDFYKLVCKPNNIGYQDLMILINSVDEVAAAWNFCERVYRGDEILCRYVKQFIPSITDEELDSAFLSIN